MNAKYNIFTILFLLAVLNSFSQKIDSYIESLQSVPFQKLYLHTDREFYFSGDTLWFAAYLVNGKFVNGISQSSQKSGYICLESEGAEIHFRNLRIVELP